MRRGPGDFEPYLEQLRGLPFAREVKLAPARPPLDATLHLRTPTEAVKVPVELKRSHLGNELAGALIHMRTTLPDLIVMAPVVGRDIADRFERASVQFVDLAGNCYVRVGDRYVARRQGLKAPRPSPADRSLRWAGYRVLFALVAKPELARATTRTLAAAAGGVSLQTTTDVKKGLIDRGEIVISRGSPRWAPGGWRATRDQFLAGFSTTLRPRLVIGRFRARETDIARSDAALAARLAAVGEWRWGAGAACQLLTGHFRGDRTIVYVERAVVRPGPTLGLVADAQGPVMICARPGPVAFDGPRPDTVHPLLAYADLLAEGDERARDGAEEIHRAFLAPLEQSA